MKLSLISSLLLLAALPIFAEDKAPPGTKDLMTARAIIGPLQVLEILGGDNNCVVFPAWSSNTKATFRRIDGKKPSENDSTPKRICFLLGHVSPRSSRDPVMNKHFNSVYETAITQLLGDREFWSTTQSAHNGPRSTLMLSAILSFDEGGKKTLQEELVKNGWAVVRIWGDTTMIERYREGYRDKLLMLQGEARYAKRGIWGDRKVDLDPNRDAE